jgi:hypothetical protein
MEVNMVNLINTGFNLIDFSRGVGWGLAVNNCDPDYPVKFKDLETYGYHINVFYPTEVRPGDIILRNMRSGMVGAFECQHNFKRVDYSAQTSFGPRDNYAGDVISCGYFNRQTHMVEVFTGYGIKSSIADVLKEKMK